MLRSIPAFVLSAYGLRKALVAAALLALVTAPLYMDVAGNDLVYYDDSVYNGRAVSKAG
ncbi:MAG: hypothetical protein JW768_16275 [Chitinispirillaceae bacterium]|nr:hypothetical protein [Chitinispirillaceae bacterium]